MKKFSLIVLALCALLGGNAKAQVQGPIYCNKSSFSTVIVTGTTTLLIPQPATGSARTYICGYTYLTGTVSAMLVTLESGTQTTTPCDTNPVPITPAAQPGSNAIAGDNSEFFRGLELPAGAGLCFVTSGTTISVAVQVYYAQQ